MCERLAAICAAPEDRDALARRAARHDRARARRVAGACAPTGLEAHVEELGAHLRAILRDVLCGHLDPALRTLADGILASDEQPAEPTAF